MTTDHVAEVYRDEAGDFRYRIKAANGEIIAEGEGYVEKQPIFEMLHRHFPDVPIVDQTIPL